MNQPTPLNVVIKMVKTPEDINVAKDKAENFGRAIRTVLKNVIQASEEAQQRLKAYEIDHFRLGYGDNDTIVIIDTHEVYQPSFLENYAGLHKHLIKRIMQGELLFVKGKGDEGHEGPLLSQPLQKRVLDTIEKHFGTFDEEKLRLRESYLVELLGTQIKGNRYLFADMKNRIFIDAVLHLPKDLFANKWMYRQVSEVLLRNTLYPGIYLNREEFFVERQRRFNIRWRVSKKGVDTSTVTDCYKAGVAKSSETQFAFRALHVLQRYFAEPICVHILKNEHHGKAYFYFELGD